MFGFYDGFRCKGINQDGSRCSHTSDMNDWGGHSIQNTGYCRQHLAQKYGEVRNEYGTVIRKATGPPRTPDNDYGLGELPKYKAKYLQNILRRHGFPTSGKKEELLSRIQLGGCLHKEWAYRKMWYEKDQAAAGAVMVPAKPVSLLDGLSDDEDSSSASDEGGFEEEEEEESLLAPPPEKKMTRKHGGYSKKKNEKETGKKQRGVSRKKSISKKQSTSKKKNVSKKKNISKKKNTSKKKTETKKRTKKKR